MKEEKKQKIDDIKTYTKFNKSINDQKNELQKITNEFKKNKKTIMGYGASGRGTIMSNFCKLSVSKMSYVIDDAPAKIGNFLPGTHQKIISSEILKTHKRPDFIILFAWAFSDEIIKKNKKYLEQGGKFIVPLPSPRII